MRVGFSITSVVEWWYITSTLSANKMKCSGALGCKVITSLVISTTLIQFPKALVKPTETVLKNEKIVYACWGPFSNCLQLPKSEFPLSKLSDFRNPRTLLAGKQGLSHKVSVLDTDVLFGRLWEKGVKIERKKVERHRKERHWCSSGDIPKKTPFQGTLWLFEGAR